MQARSIVNKFAATLTEIKAKTIDGTVRYIWAKALVKRKTDTLLDVRVRIMPTYSVCEERLKWRPMDGSTRWLRR